MDISSRRPRFGGALLLILLSLSLGGCLTVERKEYRFTLNPDGSGVGAVIFHNIQSMEEEGDLSVSDYRKLVTDYMKGRVFEEQNPQYSNVKKRLFEREGKLFGEITFEFLVPEDIGLYRHQGKGPWMYFTGGRNGVSGEEFESTNGLHGGEKMPVIFWDEAARNFIYSTRLDNGGRVTHSLLSLYRSVGTE